MPKVSSIETNEIVFISILKKIVDRIVSSDERCTQKEILDNYIGPPEAKESEIRQAIEWGIRHNYLQRELKQPRDFSLLSLTGEKVHEEFCNNVEIVISIPPLAELGLERIKIRNKMIDTKEAFRQVISRAQRVLRICSPFFERNVLDRDGFPKIKELLLDAFERGCEIRILSREIFIRRSQEFNWIKDLARDREYSHLLKIYDYHLESYNGGIISSTHSKLLIADVSLAYIGSGELRKNSLVHNFEVGCLVQGPVVSGLCEAFDLMTAYSKEW